MDRFRKPRLLPALMAAVMAVAWPLESAGQRRADPPSYDTPPPARGEWTPPVRRGDDGGGIGTAAIIAALVGGAALCAAYCKKDTKKTDALRQQLLRDGPQIPDQFALGTLSAYGFVRDGWPVVLDYETAQGADTTLTITVGDKDWTVPLPGGRQLVKLRYEGAGRRSRRRRCSSCARPSGARTAPRSRRTSR